MKNTIKTVITTVVTVLVMCNLWVVLPALWIACGVYVYACSERALWEKKVNYVNPMIIIMVALWPILFFVTYSETRRIYKEDFAKLFPNKKVTFQWPVKIESAQPESFEGLHARTENLYKFWSEGK